MNQKAQCAFCNRPDPPGMHDHHIVPKCKGGKTTAPTCGSCGSFIHATWSHNELRDQFNTVEAIQQDPRYQTFLKWLKKQPVTTKFKTIRRNGREEGKYK